MYLIAHRIARRMKKSLTAGVAWNFFVVSHEIGRHMGDELNTDKWDSDSFIAIGVGPVTVTGTSSRILLSSLDGCAVQGGTAVKIHAELSAAEGVVSAVTLLATPVKGAFRRLSDDDIDFLTQAVCDAVSKWICEGGGDLLAANEAVGSLGARARHAAALISATLRQKTLTEELASAPVSAAERARVVNELLATRLELEQLKADLHPGESWIARGAAAG